MQKLKFSIHPLFLVLGLVMVFSGNGFVFFIYLATVLLHELGHSTVALRLGYHLNSFCLLPQGALVSGNQQFFNYTDEVKIALAGPLVNVIVCVICVSLWWIAPETYIYTSLFVTCNVVTAVFNILPILPLDGGRCFVALLSKVQKRNLAIRICNFLGAIISGLFLILFIISCFSDMNFTFIVISIFIIVGIISPTKNNVYVNNFSKKVKLKNLEKGMKVKGIIINDNSYLYKLVPLLSRHSYNIIYVANEFMEIVAVLHECEIENILEKHQMDKRIKEVL